MKLIASEQLNERLAHLTEADEQKLEGALDAGRIFTCTTGYGNDGSTAFEVLENGFELAMAAIKARKSDVYYGRTPGSAPYSSYYLIPANSPEEALRTLNLILK